MKEAFVFVVFLALAGGRAYGADSLVLAIPDLDAAATACGISKAQLEGVAGRTLEVGRWQTVALDGRLSLRVTGTQARRNVCTARISVEMKASAPPLSSVARAASTKRSPAPLLVLCDKGGLASATKADFAREVDGTIEYWIRQCLRSLKY